MNTKRLSVIIPFHRGTDYLKDCLDSIKEQSMFVHFDVLEGKKGFEGLDRLRSMAGLEGREAVAALFENGDLTGLSGFNGIKGYRDLIPFLDEYEKKLEGNEESSEETSAEELERPYFYIPYRDYEVILVYCIERNHKKMIAVFTDFIYA